MASEILKWLLELFVHGWALAAVLLALLLRPAVKELLARVDKLRLDVRGLKLESEHGHRSLPSEQVEPTSVPALPATTATPALPPALPAEHGKAGTKESAAASPRPADAPPIWYRAGNIFWLGHNIMFAALAIAAGQTVDGLREWDRAIHHAKQVELSPGLIDALRELRSNAKNFEDNSVRNFVVNSLATLAVRAGKELERRQPDFRERDIEY
jgi:hypothetical protein